jgi:hypothetical protein
MTWPRVRRDLQLRGKVRRFSHNIDFLSLPAPNLPADHNDPRGNTDAGLQRHPGARADSLHLCDGCQASPDSALRVVLMCYRIAEEDENSVAHVSGDEPFKACHRIGHSAAIRTDQTAKILRVETGRQTRRAHEIAEHHGQLTALRGTGWRVAGVTSL